jgi:hypothetical protein
MSVTRGDHIHDVLPGDANDHSVPDVLNDRLNQGDDDNEDGEFRLIDSNPRFNKNPFARTRGHLAAGEEGGPLDFDQLFPEGRSDRNIGPEHSGIWEGGRKGMASLGGGA